MRDLFFFYPHSTSIKTEKSLDFLELSEPAAQHPSVLTDQISDFLQFNSKIVVFGTVVHIGLDNYFCMRILRMVDSCPNFSLTLMHRLLACLLGFG
jgi:hypothetical protein